MSDIVTMIDLLRHGQPVGGRKFRGSVDDPLSERGWQQMRSAVGDHHPWDVMLSSPLARCADFASELSRRHDIPLEMEDRFRELSFGAWDGREVAAIESTEAEALSRFWQDPLNNPPPQGELLESFDARVVAAWESLLQRHRGRHVLTVCHGGIIRVILRHVLDMSLSRLWRLSVPYASLSRVRFHSNPSVASPQLLFHAGSLG